MLKQRILTALVLAPLVIGALFFLTVDQFLIALNVVLLIAAWEWSALAGLEKLPARVAYVAVHAVGLWALHQFVGYSPSFELFILPLCLWGMALWWVIRYPSAGIWQHVSIRMFIGLLVILPCWLAFVVLKMHPSADQVLLVLLLLVWGADVGAYFAGKKFGVTRLAAVSPGKTREGVYPFAFIGILNTLIILMFGGPQMSPEYLSVFSLAFVLGISMESGWFGWAQGIGLDSLWIIYLTAVGISQWTKLSSRQCTIIALAPFAIIWGVWAFFLII